MSNAAKIAVWTVALWCAGCANHNRAIIRSFEDITSGKHKEGWRFSQVHAASVTGLLPFESVGESYFFSDKRGVLTGVGISDVQENNARGESTITYKLVREYASEATVADLISARDGIADSTAWSIKALRAQRAYWLALTNQSALADELKKEYESAEKKADAAWKQVQTAIGKKNVLLFRWDASSSRSGLLKAASFFSLGGTKDTAQQGYGLVAGLRTSTLHVGTDLLEQLAKDIMRLTPQVRQNILVPTFSICASN